MSKTVKSFIRQIKARLRGDSTSAKAEKIYRSAQAALEGQIAALKSEELKAERAVEKAQEKLDIARYPEEIIEDDNQYISNISAATKHKKDAEKHLESIRESMATYKRMMEENEAEVEAPTEEKEEKK